MRLDFDLMPSRKAAAICLWLADLPEASQRTSNRSRLDIRLRLSNKRLWRHNLIEMAERATMFGDAGNARMDFSVTGHSEILLLLKLKFL